MHRGRRIRLLLKLAACAVVLLVVVFSPEPASLTTLSRPPPQPRAHGRPLRDRMACYGARGRWVRPSSRRQLYDDLLVKPHDGGDAARHLSHAFVWQADPVCGVQLTNFSAERVCASLAGRALLFVGDSMTLQHHHSVVAALGRPLVDAQMPQWPHTGYNVCAGHDLCGEGASTFHVRFVRNDWLSLVDELVAQRENGLFEHPWARSVLKERPFDAIVLNRGAHFAEDSRVLAGLNETLTWLAAHYPRMRILWRDTPHGHSRFDEMRWAEPLEEDDNEQGAEYHWPRFAAQNGVVRAFLTSTFPSVFHLDVAHATNLRADLHLDGLHYLLPGPVDAWSIALFAFLADVLDERKSY